MDGLALQAGRAGLCRCAIMTDIPTLVAHRGYAAHWPENTLPALDAAVAAGARWVEVDVQLCADGVPVLLHDADLERVTGRALSVFDLSGRRARRDLRRRTRALRRALCGGRAPTLAEFAAWLAGHPESAPSSS
jgi:glycerophosphoryl diester phosphodiesterase